MKLNEKNRSRKLWLFIVLFATATTAMFVDKAQFAEWSSFMQWIFAAYIGGNVGAKYVQKNQIDSSSK